MNLHLAPNPYRALGEGDIPPFVNAVEGGAVTPRRRAGRAWQCAGRVGSKGSIASPRQPLPGFERAESFASPAVIPRTTICQHFLRRGCNPAWGGRTGWAACRRAYCWMSAEQRTGKGEEMIAATVGADILEGDHSIPSATAAGVRRGGVPRQLRCMTRGSLACFPYSCRYPRDLHHRVSGKARAVERPGGGPPLRAWGQRRGRAQQCPGRHIALQKPERRIHPAKRRCRCRVCWASTAARWATSRPVGSKRRAGLLLRQLH